MAVTMQQEKLYMWKPINETKYTIFSFIANNLYLKKTCHNFSQCYWKGSFLWNQFVSVHSYYIKLTNNQSGDMVPDFMTFLPNFSRKFWIFSDKIFDITKLDILIYVLIRNLVKLIVRSISGLDKEYHFATWKY